MGKFSNYVKRSAKGKNTRSRSSSRPMSNTKYKKLRKQGLA